jgi:hypothetical protein
VIGGEMNAVQIIRCALNVDMDLNQSARSVRDTNNYFNHLDDILLENSMEGQTREALQVTLDNQWCAAAPTAMIASHNKPTNQC